MFLEDEIAALRDNFIEYYYAFQHDWLERNQINFQAIQALWDILNNVYDNLDDDGITLKTLQPALQLVETMNAMVAELQDKSDPQAIGLIFSGTRDEYTAFGNKLLESLYQLEQHVQLARAQLIDIAGQE